SLGPDRIPGANAKKIAKKSGENSWIFPLKKIASSRYFNDNVRVALFYGQEWCLDNFGYFSL
ncbi:hypothetical protein ABEB36_006287, partial [Hypothenemus hampei]